MSERNERDAWRRPLLYRRRRLRHRGFGRCRRASTATTAADRRRRYERFLLDRRAYSNARRS